MYDTNVLGLNICSREAINIMKENEIKAGHIININRFKIQKYYCYSDFCYSIHVVF